MKRTLILLLTSLYLVPSVNHSAETAKARLVCLSFRFQRGTAVDSIGGRWDAEFTTIAGINGELAPDFLVPPTGYSNATFVELESEFLGSFNRGIIVIDIPETGDANGNGFWDFFEVSQAVISLPAPGAYSIPSFGNGGFTATWYRDPGSAVGSCFYTIPAPSGFGNLSFSHGFDLIELEGQLAYTPGQTTVSGSLSLTNTNSLSSLEGPVTFIKVSTNRFNRLILQSAFLTNASQQALDLYTNTTFLRRTVQLTNYYGNVEFNDGDPNTTEEDYYTWMLSVDDLNDADHDGIPDFSDDPPGASPPRPPQLSLTLGPTNLLLTIRGDVGRLHHVLEASNLASGNWLTNLSLTLTNDPQTVSIPLPATMPTFWRALAL